MPNARDSLQTLVAETLAETADTHGYRLAAARFSEQVELDLAKGGTSFVVWLEPTNAARRCFRQTRLFNVGHRGDPPDRAGYTAIDLLCARLRVWEESLAPSAVEELFAAAQRPTPTAEADGVPDLEWRAVRSGLKPASRNVASSARIDELLVAARQRGLRCEAIHADAFVAGFCAANQGMDAIVYTAREDAALHAVVAAERALIEADRQRKRAPDALIRDLGVALGYPPCCIDAFLPLRDLSNGEIRFHALGRTTGTPCVLLNDTIEGRVVVSHAVCRYDCTASANYARALIADLGRDDPRGPERLERRLRGLVLLFANGAVLRLQPSDAPSTGDRFSFCAVEEHGDGEPFITWRSALRAGDAVRIGDTTLRVYKGDRELDHLALNPDAVRMGLFR